MMLILLDVDFEVALYALSDTADNTHLLVCSHYLTRINTQEPVMGT